MIRHIVFDMGNVLIAWSPEKIVAREGLDEKDAALLQREVFACWEWAAHDRGTLSDDECLELVMRRLPERLRENARHGICDWWKPPFDETPGIAALIDELKDLGYGIYLLSNASAHLHQYFPRLPGAARFDGRIVSADWKLLKPEHELFEVLLREYALRPEDCFFIDDNPINIESAVRLGMQGAVFFKDVSRLRRELIAAGVPVKEA